MHGDPDAVAIFEEYNKVAMTNFYFADDEFEALFEYLKNPPVEEVVVESTSEVIASEEGMSTSTLLMIIALVLLILVYILISLKNQLKPSLNQPTETILETIQNQYSAFVGQNINKVFIGLIVAVVLAKFSYDAMMGVGVTTNYAPAQPIAFSHKIHHGVNGVDCNYCHSSARHSKHSGIPSANVCMNCHTYINEEVFQEQKK